MKSSIHAIGTMTRGSGWCMVGAMPSAPMNLVEPEIRAQRLGYALRGLAADLVDERQKVAALRREVAELKARLKSLS